MGSIHCAFRLLATAARNAAPAYPNLSGKVTELETDDLPPPPPAPPPPRAVAFCGPSAHIDRTHLRDGGLIVPEDPVTGLLEEFRIVKRECNRMRRGWKMLTNQDEDERIAPVVTPPPLDWRMDIARMMATLPPHYRTILLLRDVEGMALEELAEALELSFADGSESEVVEFDFCEEELVIQFN